MCIDLCTLFLSQQPAAVVPTAGVKKVVKPTAVPVPVLVKAADVVPAASVTPASVPALSHPEARYGLELSKHSIACYDLHHFNL